MSDPDEENSQSRALSISFQDCKFLNFWILLSYILSRRLTGLLFMSYRKGKGKVNCQELVFVFLLTFSSPPINSSLLTASHEINGVRKEKEKGMDKRLEDERKG